MAHGDFDASKSSNTTARKAVGELTAQVDKAGVTLEGAKAGRQELRQAVQHAKEKTGACLAVKRGRDQSWRRDTATTGGRLSKRCRSAGVLTQSMSYNLTSMVCGLSNKINAMYARLSCA